MSRLSRTYPLAQIKNTLTFEGFGIKMNEMRDLGFLRISSREISGAFDVDLANTIGAGGAISPNEVSGSAIMVAALSRRERLIFGKLNDIQFLEQAIRDIADISTLVVDVTHQFTAIEFSGEGATEVMSSLTPLSFDGDRFAVGRCLRTVFADTVIFVHRLAGDANYLLVFDQSVAGYAWRSLKDAAMKSTIQ